MSLGTQFDNEFFLRELTDDEALKLREPCLAAQAEESARQGPAPIAAPDQAQLGLF